MKWYEGRVVGIHPSRAALSGVVAGWVSLVEVELREVIRLLVYDGFAETR
jgi:hypothetical protein